MLIKGDARAIPLKDGTVQCCVTSPPYWGLRDYKCDGQLGLERTPEDYVASIVAVMREVWRVLRDDGTLWLNLGDSYTGSGKGGNPDAGKQATNRGSQSIGVLYGKTGQSARDAALTNVSRRWTSENGMAPKNLVGIPWRVAFALQVDGWYLRSDIIWSKPNPMPESVTDRPTKAHEYIFLLTKSERYFWDQEAVKEPSTYSEPNAPDKIKSPYGQGFTRRARDSFKRNGSKRQAPIPFQSLGTHRPEREESNWDISSRNIRSVWEIATQPYSGAHLTTFPREIPERCIKAGTSEKGCCPKCRAPWERVKEVIEHAGHKPRLDEKRFKCGSGEHRSSVVQFSGWQPTCSCNAGEPVPCIVYDPFCGTGTVQMVARDLGRIGIGSDLTYQDLAADRIQGPLFAKTVNSDRLEANRESDRAQLELPTGSFGDRHSGS